MKNVCLLALAIVLSFSSQAQEKIKSDPNEIRFWKEVSPSQNSTNQNAKSISKTDKFTKQNPTWVLQTDKLNQMPTYAFGKPIPSQKSNSKEASIWFIDTYLKDLGVEPTSLKLSSERNSTKYHYIDYVQYQNDIEVLYSNVQFRMNDNNDILSYKAKYYSDIKIDIAPSISKEQAKVFATYNIEKITTSAEVNNLLKILPTPTENGYMYYLVYEVIVNTIEGNNKGKYQTLVDAHTGAILNRKNLVAHMSSPGDTISVNADLYTTHPYNPSSFEQLPYLQVNIGGTNYNTGANGKLEIPGTPGTATLSLQGPWAKTVTGPTGTTTSSQTVSLTSGMNNISFTGAPNINYTSCYYHVNKVHDFVNTILPTYNGMDFQILARLDRTDGDCNAFYDGNLNFYVTGNGCFALSQVGDVIYHEYGHGLADHFYTDNGTFFQNGALGEGYADVLSLSITKNPILGIGLSDTDPTDFVRRYDVNKKVYPYNIVGEVHADGEIIAGAWWDSGQNYASGSMGYDWMIALWSEALYALPNAADGNEGTLYYDILIDALYADDVDGDLTNGTPNLLAITDGFATHGIYLLGDVNFSHSPVENVDENDNITLNATVTVGNISYLDKVKVHYRTRNVSPWTSGNMAVTFGSNYTFDIPGVNKGNIVDYYFSVVDISGRTVFVKPFFADSLSNPNLPYQVLVGYESYVNDDFSLDNLLVWQLGDVDDDASTGSWLIDNIVGSEVSPGVPCQTSSDHTPTSDNECAFTGVAASTAGVGTADIDEGKTTIFSPVFDMSSKTNPAISYWRWYSNDQGANPRNDTWKVYISNDGGAIWKYVERTNVPDHSWRKNAIRVKDYVTLSNAVMFKFVASDSLTPGSDSFNGGSLVEAALDDFTVWDEAGTLPIDTTSINELATLPLVVYPNPSHETVTVEIPETSSTLSIYNAQGQLVFVKNNLNKTMYISTKELSNGVYTVLLSNSKRQYIQKLSIIHR